MLRTDNEFQTKSLNPAHEPRTLAATGLRQRLWESRGSLVLKKARSAMQGSGIVSLICKVEGQASKVWTWRRFSESEEVVWTHVVFVKAMDFKLMLSSKTGMNARSCRARSHTICQTSRGAQRLPRTVAAIVRVPSLGNLGVGTS